MYFVIFFRILTANSKELEGIKPPAQGPGVAAPPLSHHSPHFTQLCDWGMPQLPFLHTNYQKNMSVQAYKLCFREGSFSLLIKSLWCCCFFVLTCFRKIQATSPYSPRDYIFRDWAIVSKLIFVEYNVVVDGKFMLLIHIKIFSITS